MFLSKPPPSIVHFANIIQKPSLNLNDDLKASVLQYIQPFAAERVRKRFEANFIA
ncbi:unnamed protein product [Hymenolepis diminuta]|uniref:Uncharacterized protein n=1 Tax=Hymenolepis diminuta TaxID=6216 RepID=A0A564Z8V6_HYMDI|nr:unnamed protein product [Hymenolepis diminuta]